MKLFCVHIIEQRLIDSTSDEILKLKNVHFHWRFNKFQRHYHELENFVNIDETKNDETFTQDFLLLIQNSRQTKVKNCFKNVNNRSRVKKSKSEIFTRRESFEFEYALIVDFTTNVQMFVNQFFVFIQFTSIARSRIQSFNLYSNFIFYQLISTFYFVSFFQFFLSTQSLFNQLYNHWQLVETQIIFIAKVTTKSKRKKNETKEENRERENTKRAKKWKN